MFSCSSLPFVFFLRILGINHPHQHRSQILFCTPLVPFILSTRRYHITTALPSHISRTPRLYTPPFSWHFFTAALHPRTGCDLLLWTTTDKKKLGHWQLLCRRHVWKTLIPTTLLKAVDWKEKWMLPYKMRSDRQVCK